MNGAEGIVKYVPVFEDNLVSLTRDRVKSLSWTPFLAVPGGHDVVFCNLNLDRCHLAGSG